MNTAFYSFRNSLLRFIFFLLLPLSLAVPSFAQPIISLTPVIETGLSAPIQFVHAGDGSNRVFIVQKGGTIRAYDASFNFLSTFLTVTDVATSGEQGLLSLAFHPAYASNGLLYVYYSNTAGDLVIARYQVSNDPNIANAASKVIVLTIPHPVNSNHNGGELHFGSDGYLYLSTGDGGGGGDQANNAQNTGVLLGKLLRLNVNTSATAPFYSIPPGNPFSNEVFDLGLRNPFRWSFDRLNNDIWIGDVGQDSFEEINYRAAGNTGGVNYGWRCYEGNNPFNTSGCGPSSSYVFPAYAYPSQNPAAAVTGGIVYRGTALPALEGYYVAADFYSGLFYMILPDGAGGFTTQTQAVAVTGIADFGETENNEAYVVSLTANTVYRVNAVEGAPVPVNLVSFSGNIYNRQAVLSWKTSYEINLQQFDVEYSTDGSVFAHAGTVQAQHSASGGVYEFSHSVAVTGPVFYRLKMTDENGSFQYSAVVRLVLNDRNAAIVAPSVITDGIVSINLTDRQYDALDIVNAAGVPVVRRKITGITGRLNIPVGDLAPGIYVVRLLRTGSTSVETQQVYIQ